eukprot:m.1060 g.1060  ORF g.1060 m.1060 type:complete len:65 (-) comp880_c0_seq1:83-277(-)
MTFRAATQVYQDQGVEMAHLSANTTTKQIKQPKFQRLEMKINNNSTLFCLKEKVKSTKAEYTVN